VLDISAIVDMVYEIKERIQTRGEICFRSRGKRDRFSALGTATTVQHLASIPSVHLGSVLQASPAIPLMKWGRFWPEIFVAVAVLTFKGARWFQATDAASPPSGAPGWTPQRKLAARCALSQIQENIKNSRML